MGSYEKKERERIRGIFLSFLGAQNLRGRKREIFGQVMCKKEKEKESEKERERERERKRQ